MQNSNLSDIVTVMDRGQITIPIEIREMFQIKKGMKLWVKIRNQREVILEPAEENKRNKLKKFLEKAIKDKHAYWTKEDDKNLAKVRKKTMERLKLLQW